MDVQTTLFYVFSAVLLFAALRVITARNPVHSALYLVLAFFQMSAIWLLLRAEFLAIVLVLVYVGAVMVLFLFVVMMLDINLDTLRKGFWRYFPVAALVGVLIVLEMAAVLMQGFQIGGMTRAAQVGAAVSADNPLAHLSNTRALGVVLYSQYLFAVEIAAVILLVAIIAAIALTLRKRKDVRNMPVSEQLKARRKDRVRLVSLPAQPKE
ncbi:MAG: NADH-quinone oxidoreductase subunit J [Thiomonas sp.]|uniref:NADH-quinone oxidoreductase subunit J n=1 Tax=Thiomonas sp. TaxID=2047785 RepID=UPI002A36E162|nr:NADH-quinone oxidoreductase subunit J [Thiomonas sp.]MDY0330039.1 NADH-quinone oxidoreductase subunit J [Thiomonas sp.]